MTQIGKITHRPTYAEPWRVQVEDCELGFRTQDQAQEFAERYLALTNDPAWRHRVACNALASMHSDE